jgi:hypothetical protein
LPEDLRKVCATANLEPKFVHHNGIPLFYFVATREIKKGEQLGWDYGEVYWLSQISQGQTAPLIFDQQGIVLEGFHRYTCKVEKMVLLYESLKKANTLLKERKFSEFSSSLKTIINILSVSSDEVLEDINKLKNQKDTYEYFSALYEKILKYINLICDNKDANSTSLQDYENIKKNLQYEDCALHTYIKSFADDYVINENDTNDVKEKEKNLQQLKILAQSALDKFQLIAPSKEGKKEEIKQENEEADSNTSFMELQPNV